MKNGTRALAYDEALQAEAFRFEGIVQPFPNHFHEHYVLGLVEGGERRLSCKNRDYTIGRGCVLLFHPGDNHACAQSGGGAFDYRGFNIPLRVMVGLAEEVTGRRAAPVFSQNVLCDAGIARPLRSLHEMAMHGGPGPGKEEALLLLACALMQRYGQPFESATPECPQEIEKACAFIRRHYSERIDLGRICRHAGLSKSTLLRAFTRAKGVTPYRYLEAIRINEAKALLRKGVPPVEAAMRTGFSDQSHFTNYFNRFIGVSPGVYRSLFFGTGGGRGQPVHCQERKGSENGSTK